MSSGFDYRKFCVMYVDDEAQSLKYFQKNFQRDFRIITAENTDAALEILAKQGREIGVLMTDQRMPGAPGTELLNKTRQQYPEITRILVTAYSDLDTAVDSVNEGGAFRYLTKPWDMRELKGVLLRAMEFFLLQRDRNQLVREKMVVSQQMITMDRLRSVATFLGAAAADCPSLASGFRDYAVVASHANCARVQLDSSATTDLWNLTRLESVRLIQTMQALGTPHVVRDDVPTETIDWRAAFDKCAGQFPGSGAKLEIPAGVTTEGNPDLATVLIDSLLRAVVKFPDSKLTLRDDSGTAVIEVMFAAADNDSGLRKLFARVIADVDTSIDLLDAFLAIAAMGGCASGTRVESGLQLNFAVGGNAPAASTSGFDTELFERVYSVIEEA